MIDLRRLGLTVILSAATASSALAQSMVERPAVYASNETASKPWAAPVGHRQPHAVDVPASRSASQRMLDDEDARVDRAISAICRGC